jgi:fatty-acyl-CoA synthase
MNGLMMETPLLVSSLIRHAARHHGHAQIVSRRVEGDITRYTYRDAHARSRKLANALARLGAKPGDRIATLAWNGPPALRALLRDLRLRDGLPHGQSRLFPDQIAWIVNDAEDHTLFFDSLCAR